MSLLEKLSEVTGQAFSAEGIPSSLGTVRVSDRPDLAQYQCNGAMAAAKQARKNPRAVAEAVVVQLRKHSVFSKIDIAGPGFINLDVTDEFLSGFLEESANGERCGVPRQAHGETVVLDYGGMNVAKAMHVGHLRPNVIGDALKRIMRFAGYNALGDIDL